MAEAKIVNPSTNSLPAGISLEDVEAAITSSGYPLQVEVANRLDAAFSVQQEWSFVDADSGAQRSLDILAVQRLHDDYEGRRVYPYVSLLVECKQSKSPFVFFADKGDVQGSEYPVICGLASDTINVHDANRDAGWDVDVNEILKVEGHRHLSAPVSCHIFSKAARNGKKFELSGSDPYQSIMLPLAKALAHYRTVTKPRSTFSHFTAHFTFAVAVIDAPMVVSRGGTLEFAPWVRTFRHEHVPVEDGPSYGRRIAVDVVHADFLMTFINDYLQPYVEAAASKINHLQICLAEGEAIPANSTFGFLSDNLLPVPAARDEHGLRVNGAM